MKKEEFIKQLKEKLDILEPSEIEDIVKEYEGYIDEKIKKGATEEEAIADFGDIDELITELLKAYKINVNHQKKDKGDVVNNVIDKFMNWIDKFIRQFEGKSSSDIIRMIIEIFLILLIIGFCKLPFHLLENLGYDVFMVFNNGLGSALYHIWKFVMEFSYLIVAIVLFVKIFEKRFLQNVNYEEEIAPNNIDEKKLKKTNEKKSNSVEEHKTKETVIVKQKGKGFIDFLSAICVGFIKFIAGCILLGVGCYLLGMAIAVGFGVYLLIQGVTYYGVFISLLVLLSLGGIFFEILFNFIFNKKNNTKVILVSLILNIIILGFSFSYASIEIANTEFVDSMPENVERKEATETLVMKSDYILFGNIDEYLVDETLTNEIKIVYTYTTFGSILSPSINIRNQNEVSLNWYYEKFNWNKEFKERVLEELRNKKIHNYSNVPVIKVYASAENIDLLKKNKVDYQESQKNYKSQKKRCKYEYDEYGYGMLSEECKEILFD